VAGAGELPGQFERVPGRGWFHVRAGRNESRPMVGTTALTDRTHGDRIRTLGAGKDGGHGEERLERTRRRREMVKTFSEGV
jgi:hypothetical protein